MPRTGIRLFKNTFQLSFGFENTPGFVKASPPGAGRNETKSKFINFELIASFFLCQGMKMCAPSLAGLI